MATRPFFNCVCPLHCCMPTAGANRWSPLPFPKMGHLLGDLLGRQDAPDGDPRRQLGHRSGLGVWSCVLLPKDLLASGTAFGHGPQMPKLQGCLPQLSLAPMTRCYWRTLS